MVLCDPLPREAITENMSLLNPLDLEEVIRPRTIAEALVHLARRDVTPYPLAGGTRLLARSASGIRAVLDLGALGLDYIRTEAGELHIGAMITLQDVAESDVAADVARGLLVRAAWMAAPRVQRHQQTVGGTVAGAEGDDDFLVALEALDARVVYYLPGDRDTARVLPLTAFLTEVRSRPPFLIVEVRVPVREGARAALQRVARTPRDRAIVNVAVVLHLDGDTVAEARVVAGGVAELPVRLQRVETLLAGRALDEVSMEEVEEAARVAVAPIDDWRASADYRRHLVGVLTRRAIQSLISNL